MKIVNNYSSDNAHHEHDIEKHISEQNRPHRGRGIIRTFYESFDVTGPEGNHLCLTYEPMREPLWILQRRFVSQKLPISIAKAYILILLAGVDFLHTECKVVHTGTYTSHAFPSLANKALICIYLSRLETRKYSDDFRERKYST